MIRPTSRDETEILVALANDTGVFKALEINALREVLHDYHAGSAGPDHQCVTFEQDGQPVGFAYFALAEMTDRAWQLWWIVVSPHTQARGIGGRLLKHVESEVHRATGRLLLIETSSTLHYEPTRRFYVKHGYENDAVLRDFYADGDDMVVFRKRISEPEA